VRNKLLITPIAILALVFLFYKISCPKPPLSNCQRTSVARHKERKLVSVETAKERKKRYRETRAEFTRLKKLRRKKRLQEKDS